MDVSPPNLFTVHTPEIIYDVDKFDTIMYTVQFTISNFKSTKKSVFKSPVFSVGNNHEFDAEILYFPSGSCNKNCHKKGIQYHNSCGHRIYCVSIEFVPKVANTNVACPKGSASFFVRNDDESNRWNVIAENCLITKIDKQCYAGRCSFALQMTKTNFLIIKCKLKLQMVVALIGIKQPLVTGTADGGTGPSDSKLQEDLSNLIQNTHLADVTLVIGSQECKAHKVILAARSPVFARMFQTEMTENKQNVVKISDMDFVVLQSLLIYMYTDNVPGLDTHREALLSAAEKYQLDGLKEKCGASLAEGLTVENAARVFLVADLHRAKLLKDKAVEFIKKNMQAVQETEGWMRAKEDHHLVLVKTFL